MNPKGLRGFELMVLVLAVAIFIAMAVFRFRSLGCF